MQTLLGAGGAIGRELAKALPAHTESIRLVSRNPHPVNDTDQLLGADLTQTEHVAKAVEGSKVVYLTVGLPYSFKVWQKAWPKLMKDTIEACRTHGARLVFFDNVYMYDPNHLGAMTEETPVAPTSKKGLVRAQIALMILDEISSGNLEALICRSADFYGPGIKNTSMLTETVFKNFARGKKANWLGSDQYRHSFTYTPDAGKATALLGNTDDAFNQIWHLPTAANPMTGKEWIEAIASEMKVEPKYQTLPKFLVSGIGLFSPLMGEMAEMMYQYDRDYVFDSSKFSKRFDFSPTPYLEGIKQIVAWDNYRR